MRTEVMPRPDKYSALRSDDALCISLLVSYLWNPQEIQAHVIALCADTGKVWHAIAVLRASLAWAQARGAAAWRIHADTGINIAPLMRRLGIPEDSPRYRVNFGELDGQNGHYR